MIRTGLVGLALGIFAWALLPAPTSQAVTVATWNVYPPFQISGIYDYGWHFDEALSGPTSDYGARDYNWGTDDRYFGVRFRATLTATPAYQLRYRFTHVGNCTITAVLQANFFGWVDVERTAMHYIHLGNRLANGSTTGTLTANGQSVNVVLGDTGGGGALSCGTTEPHSHVSSYQRTDTRILRDNYTADTCWSDTDDLTGTNLHQCPGTYRTHNGATTPPSGCGAWSGNTWLVSGNITEYRCELWSQQSRSYTARAFHGSWVN